LHEKKRSQHSGVINAFQVYTLKFKRAKGEGAVQKKIPAKGQDFFCSARAVLF